MFANGDREQAVHLAKAEITYWRQQVEYQKVVAEKASVELREKEGKLRTAESFMELLRERYGLQPVATPKTRFEGHALREAAVIVIANKKRLSPQKLIAELRAGGFRFGEYPARQLHAALIHQDLATRDADGFWCWVG